MPTKKVTPKETHLKRFGSSIGLYFDKRLVAGGFKWDEATELVEEYDFGKKQIIIREKSGQGVTPRIT